MELHPACLLCQSSSLEKLPPYQHAFLVQCRSCRFVFSERIPSPEELQEHYGKYPRNAPISEITLKRYDELLDGFEIYRKNNNLLDIGCGDGHFLERAKYRRWNVYGTEYTPEAVATCSAKNISMQEGKLSSSSFSVKFDVITSFEVIEHIHNPREEIHNIHSLLRKEGLFYFTTPNFNSLSRRILKNKWNVIEYPEHLSYYSPGTIGPFLEKNGFTKKSVQTTGIGLKRFAQGLNTSAAASSNMEETIRASAEKSWMISFLKKTANLLLSLTHTGDTLKGHYRKV